MSTINSKIHKITELGSIHTTENTHYLDNFSALTKQHFTNATCWYVETLKSLF